MEKNNKNTHMKFNEEKEDNNPPEANIPNTTLGVANENKLEVKEI